MKGPIFGSHTKKWRADRKVGVSFIDLKQYQSIRKEVAHAIARVLDFRTISLEIM